MIHLLLELVNEVMVGHLNWITGLRFNIWFGKTCTRNLFCKSSVRNIHPLFLLFPYSYLEECE